MERKEVDVSAQGIGSIIGELVASEVVQKLLALIIAMGKDAMIKALEIIKSELESSGDAPED